MKSTVALSVFVSVLVAVILLIGVVALSESHIPSSRSSSSSSSSSASSSEQQSAQDGLIFLQTNTDDTTTFADLTNLFEQMCADADEGEIVQFDAGTYKVDEKNVFIVSLVRKIPNGEGKYLDVRAQATFAPDAENSLISEYLEIDPTVEDAFLPIRQSAAYQYAETHTALSIDMNIGESVDEKAGAVGTSEPETSAVAP